ncbi:MAG TPA: GNAT family N-acetyltransferase [Gaiellaceae bacterium]|nr:GNAT family N-acetyltransferase [Gaiellaceae bacterium]
MSVRLREARPEDATAVAALLDDLGYPSGTEQAAERLMRIERDPTTVLVVAEVDGEVAGLAALHVQNLVERDDPGCTLAALVVAERYRRRGVGARLTEAIEAEARSRGCESLALNTAHRREDAHAFYEALGYEHTGRRYRKNL